MKPLFFSLCSFMLCCTLSLAAVPTSDTLLQVIPRPAHYLMQKGHFTLTSKTQFVARDKAARTIVDFFAPQWRAATSLPLPVVRRAADNTPTITLSLNSRIQGDEAYTLHVTPQGIQLQAATQAGLRYGMQTLQQLLPAAIMDAGVKRIRSWRIPCIEIADAPRLAYRGVMVDVCRHFTPIEELKKIVNALSLYKINTLHLHLTDDQGWRVEIRRYPKLTELGAWRTEEDGTRHGGYYTQEQLRDLVQYAAARGINIVPEFEIPGHELAAIAAYPWLSCRGDSITPRLIWGVEDIVMCPGKKKTFEFLKNVIDELVEIFPSPLFHIGGDEAPKHEWKKCPDCQALITKLGYKDMPHHPKEEQLQGYVVRQVERMLNKKGKSIIGWDEILEGGNLATSTAIMSWRGESGGIAAAEAGHQVVMTPGSEGMYIDQFQGDPKVEPMGNWGYAPLSKVYAYDPVPAVLAQKGKGHFVKGVQVNMWTEYVPTPDMLEYMIFPRALALAEIGWSVPNRKNFADFSRRVDGDAALRLSALGINYHIPIPQQPYGSTDRVVYTDTAVVTLQTSRPLPIVYTTDGSDPTAQSPRYTNPLIFTHDATLRAASLLPAGVLSPVRSISIRQQPFFAPARPTHVTQPGLIVRKAWGKYYKVAQLDTIKHWQDSTIQDIRAIRGLNYVPSNVRNVHHYAAIATGYVDIPQTGIYTFSSNNAKVCIDGVNIVDNDAAFVKRYSHGDSQVALRAGKHSIRIVFLGHIADGWPTYWDDGKVYYKLHNATQFSEITPAMLSH